MKLSQEYKTLLINEIKFVLDNMSKANSVEEKLYLFSAIFGMVQRIFNIEFNSELVFLHSVLQNTHNSFMQRLTAIKSGDTVVSLSEDQIIGLERASSQLCGAIEKNKSILPALEKFSLLGYSTSGNGNFMMIKGKLKL